MTQIMAPRINFEQKTEVRQLAGAAAWASLQPGATAAGSVQPRLHCNDLQHAQTFSTSSYQQVGSAL
jgi:hypothetical protein